MTEVRRHPLLEDHRIFLVAGVHDALSAKLAQRAGFHSVVLTGFGVSAARLGEPDVGLLTQTEMLETARRVIAAVDIPVVVDGDTGYGGVLNVARMVRELVQMGAAGILLEDQVWPKRCGHLRGKSVVPLEEHAARIAAAREARGDASLWITARTDAIAPLGLDEAIRRARAYKAAGADFIFVEAPESVEQMRRIAAEVPGPLVVNMIEGGKTPLLSLEELHELGFISVGYVLSGLFAAAKALATTYAYLLEHGSSRGLEGEMISFEAFTRLLGVEEKLAWAEQFEGDSPPPTEA
ncbi:MAG: oxaloacetate decarboxylase [Deltaproteobacteria bacterium]|nr:MAG: oxaloacetate decarboxylase [Deltaproteobacteria bacterium]